MGDIIVFFLNSVFSVISSESVFIFYSNFIRPIYTLPLFLTHQYTNFVLNYNYPFPFSSFSLYRLYFYFTSHDISIKCQFLHHYYFNNFDWVQPPKHVSFDINAKVEGNHCWLNSKVIKTDISCIFHQNGAQYVPTFDSRYYIVYKSTGKIIKFREIRYF